MYYRHTYHFFFSFSIKTETKRTEQKKKTLWQDYSHDEKLWEKLVEQFFIFAVLLPQNQSQMKCPGRQKKKIKIINTLNVCIGTVCTSGCVATCANPQKKIRYLFYLQGLAS